MLTLYCAEVPEGARLQLRNRQGEVDIQTLPLPGWLIERMNFWNHWASYALEHEYEYTPPSTGWRHTRQILPSAYHASAPTTR